MLPFIYLKPSLLRLLWQTEEKKRKNRDKLTLSPRLIMTKWLDSNIKLENHRIQNVRKYILLLYFVKSKMVPIVR